MLEALRNPSDWRASPLRAMLWVGGVALLLLPLAAMQLTDAVNWTAMDFAFAGVVVFATVIPLDFAMCRAAGGAYRAAIIVALVAMFLLAWLSASVGIIGRDGDPANLMHLPVIVVGIGGALISRLHPDGLSRTLLSMAVLQALIATIAIFGGLGLPWSGPVELAVLNAVFVLLFAVSAWLFARAQTRGSSYRRQR